MEEEIMLLLVCRRGARSCLKKKEPPPHRAGDLGDPPGDRAGRCAVLRAPTSGRALNARPELWSCAACWARGLLFRARDPLDGAASMRATLRQFCARAG